MCKVTKTCINATQVCNFHNDCGTNDNSDEISCGNCNFDENSLCGWNNIGDGSQQFVIRAANSNDMLDLPKTDGHKNTTGKYLIVAQTGGNQ